MWSIERKILKKDWDNKRASIYNGCGGILYVLWEWIKCSKSILDEWEKLWTTPTNGGEIHMGEVILRRRVLTLEKTMSTLHTLANYKFLAIYSLRTPLDHSHFYECPFRYCISLAKLTISFKLSTFPQYEIWDVRQTICWTTVLTPSIHQNKTFNCDEYKQTKYLYSKWERDKNK